MNNDLINELYSKIDNQEKIIVDLQQENTQLKIQLLEKKCSDKDIEYKEKIKLQQRIDKAINLIVKETKSMPVNGCKIRLIKLLDILKEVSE